MSRRCYSFPSCCVVGLSNSAAQEGLHMQSLWSSGRTKRKNGECIYRSIHTSKPACERAVIFTLSIFYSTSSLNSATNINPPNVTVFVCSLFGSIQEEVVKDAESVRNQQQQHLQQHSCTLDECFQLYTKEEQVGNSSWTFMKTLLAHFSSFLTDSFPPSPKLKFTPVQAAAPLINMSVDEGWQLTNWCTEVWFLHLSVWMLFAPISERYHLALVECVWENDVCVLSRVSSCLSSDFHEPEEYQVAVYQKNSLKMWENSMF